METIVNSSPSCIIVTLLGDGPLFRPSASASCNRLSDDLWWVTRVIVEPPDARRQGLGSRALQLLLAAFRKEASAGSELKVCPGGYDNNIKEQTRFYLKNGFVPEKAGSGAVLVFRLAAE